MTIEHDDLSKFQDAYLGYLEGDRDDPPELEKLPDGQRRAAEAFIKSITAARGIDPYASRPSIEQLLMHVSQTSEATSKLGQALEDHLRLTIDPRASVTLDAASTVLRLASSLVIHARGVRMRVVEETSSRDLDYSLASRASDIAKVFSAFPDSHAVLYTTTRQEPHAAVLERSDVYGAIEIPSGELREPRLPRSVASATTACEVWLKGMIPDFQPVSIDLPEDNDHSDSALDPVRLANKVVNEVSIAGGRARISAKRATWRRFGEREAQHLVTIVQKAQLGQLSEDGYISHLEKLARKAA